ncbi:hypothetical protein RHGRI_017575 [Rhododendron griersonianum]|uniref:Peptidase C1A papain C-terminal domain-containing protein n=1 Tax=Rhododendron griersonianum TaxID=479676 RepID=A0AAV6JYF1_9ERIC|nr:hypothetical protein RHGRI_017575 [Rhododendron griersonianum]
MDNVAGGLAKVRKGLRSSGGTKRRRKRPARLRRVWVTSESGLNSRSVFVGGSTELYDVGIDHGGADKARRRESSGRTGLPATERGRRGQRPRQLAMKTCPATNNETALLMAVANQPVSVAIDAGGSDFQFYSSGVFTGACGTNLDHGVAAVGYGIDINDGTKYWLVKNSWGTGWGEEENIRMQRYIAAKEGLCGIAMQPSYPTA